MITKDFRQQKKVPQCCSETEFGTEM